MLPFRLSVNEPNKCLSGRPAYRRKIESGKVIVNGLQMLCDSIEQQVVAMKRGPGTLTGIDAETTINAADLLLLLGNDNQLNRVATEVLS